MKYRTLGRSGLQVSVIGLGSWYTLGTAIDESASTNLIHAALDAGINLFDTANVYTRNWGSGEGDVEKLLGAAIKGHRRSDSVICTKVRGRMGPGPNDQGLSARHVIEQCEDSLRRLASDYIDIYLAHRPHPLTPEEEFVRAMEDLARAGKIRYWGVSNWSGWRTIKAQYTAKLIRARPMVCCQTRYNLLYRFPEHELFPATEDEGIGHIVYSPLAQGMLTGKYPPGQPPPAGSRAEDEHDGKYLRQLYFSEENKERCRKLAELAAELGITASNLALAWTLTRPQVASAITGAKTTGQLQENAAAAEVELDQKTCRDLELLFPRRSDVWIGEGEIPRLIDNQEGKT
ncbi:MAG: aldo/keto reductase [Phycisphaeraceae bacterium]|nr:aldo/keto reductase [Phycisphaeraceae bacterium]